MFVSFDPVSRCICILVHVFLNVSMHMQATQTTQMIAQVMTSDCKEALIFAYFYNSKCSLIVSRGYTLHSVTKTSINGLETQYG